MKSADKKMKRLVRDVQMWCAQSNDKRRQELLEMLERDLKSKKPAAVAHSTLDLTFLATWYSQHGALAALNGDAAGWGHIDRALQYRWWRARISTAGVFVSSAACCLAHAITAGEQYKARWLADRMILSLDDLIFNTWEVSPFAVFLMRVWGIHENREIQLDRPKVAQLGVYQAILDAWSDDEALRDAISAICDYHIDQSFDSDDSEPQFIESPYDIFPVDVLALEAIRRRMGLSTPRPDHPLLTTPLANPPPPDQRPRMGPDPLLEAVIKKARDTGFLPPEETGA